MVGRARIIGALCLVGTLALMLSSCVSFLGPTILLSSLDLQLGEQGDIVISAMNIPNGLQGIEVSAVSGQFLTFDPEMIQVSGLEAVAPFSLDAENVDNSAGKVSFIARAPAGDPFLANTKILLLHVTLLAHNPVKPGSGTPIHLEITNLADGNNQPVLGVKIVDGTVNLGSSTDQQP